MVFETLNVRKEAGVIEQAEAYRAFREWGCTPLSTSNSRATPLP